jgi:hypothetical protein
MVLPCVPILVDRDASCVPVERTLRDLHRDDNHALTFLDAIEAGPRIDPVVGNRRRSAYDLCCQMNLTNLDAIALLRFGSPERQPFSLRIAPIDLIPHKPRLPDSRFPAEGSSE